MKRFILSTVVLASITGCSVGAPDPRDRENVVASIEDAEKGLIILTQEPCANPIVSAQLPFSGYAEGEDGRVTVNCWEMTSGFFVINFLGEPNVITYRWERASVNSNWLNAEPAEPATPAEPEVKDDATFTI